MKRIIPTALLVLWLAMGGTACAGPLETCWATARNHPEASACLGDMLTRTDAELARAVHSLRAWVLLNPFYAAHPDLRDDLLARLETSMASFPGERRRWCLGMGDLLAPGNGGGDVMADCMIRAARRRLEDMRRNAAW